MKMYGIKEIVTMGNKMRKELNKEELTFNEVFSELQATGYINADGSPTKKAVSEKFFEVRSEYNKYE